jgi:hypothetical protein
MNTKFVQLFLIICLLAAPIFAAAKNFNPDKIISEKNYTDSNSMSRPQIQKFLETMESGLAKIKLEVEGAMKRVSDIFYEAAKKYNISQKLLLVTAQKEQSAITTENLTEDQKNKLMGYCIYPGSLCSDKYLGIFAQIDAAAWQFRHYINNTKLYNFQKGKTSTTSDNKQVTPKNDATAGLYNYTPYQGGERGATVNDTGWGGNFLFWKAWAGWFGDPTKSYSKRLAKILVGAGLGGGPQVRVINGDGKPTATQFYAFNQEFRGGVYVAAGDVDGDKQDEIIVGSSWGGEPYVRIFDGYPKARVKEFLAFDKKFRGGVRVAVGDLDGDGVKEIVVGAGFDGTPKVKIFDSQGNRKFKEFFAFDKNFRGGVYVTAADLDSDKKAEIITGAGEGAGPLVRIFNQNGKLKRAFFAGSQKDHFGVRVGTVDINSDGKSEIIAAGSNGDRPWVRVFSRFGKKIYEFFAFDQNFRGGVYVASGDVNGDTQNEIVTSAGLGGGPQVRVFSSDGKKVLAQFFVFDQKFHGGVRVATIK